MRSGEGALMIGNVSEDENKGSHTTTGRSRTSQGAVSILASNIHLNGLILQPWQRQIQPHIRKVVETLGTSTQIPKVYGL